MENSQATKSGKELSINQQWIDQHCSSERYILIYFTSFRLLHRFKINPQSVLGKSIIFVLLILVIFGLLLSITAILDQWDYAPIGTWALIVITICFIGAISYDMYYRIGLNVSSIGQTVVDENFFYRQIEWDRLWFNIRATGTVGVITSGSMLISMLYINRQSIATVIPAGTLLLICILSYQIGEIACILLLMCFESRVFSEVDHSLYRFNPIETESIQRSLMGYNQIGLVTSIVMTVFIVSSAILLPNSAYLTNPVWVLIILMGYSIVILTVILPRYFVQQLIRRFKRIQLTPIRQKLNNMFDQLMQLSDEEYDEMLRLIDIQDLIYKAPDSGLPFSTIGRIFGTLFMPTATLILAVVGEVYLSTLFQQILK